MPKKPLIANEGAIAADLSGASGVQLIAFCIAMTAAFHAHANETEYDPYIITDEMIREQLVEFEEEPSDENIAKVRALAEK